MMGRLLGERCDIAIWQHPDGRLDYPFMCIYKNDRDKMPTWKQWLISAAPYLFFGPIMMNKDMGWNIFDYIRFEYE